MKHITDISNAYYDLINRIDEEYYLTYLKKLCDIYNLKIKYKRDYKNFLNQIIILYNEDIEEKIYLIVENYNAHSYENPCKYSYLKNNGRDLIIIKMIFLV